MAIRSRPSPSRPAPITGPYIRTPDELAAALVRDKADKVSHFKRIIGAPQSAFIPDHVVIARFSSVSDHFGLLNFGTAPWQSPNVPTNKGNYCAHIYTMRADATPALIDSSRKLGVIYHDVPNRDGDTPLDLARRRGDPGVIAAVERATEAARQMAAMAEPDAAPARQAVRRNPRPHQPSLPFG